MIKKNIKNIIGYVLILLATIATLRIPYIVNGDELWTFANTYKLYNGISLYNENNIIVTPLFFWIGNVFFKVLGPTFFTYKIYNVILIWSLYVGTNNLLKNCNIKPKISLILTLVFMLIYRILTGVGANYTTLTLVLLVIGVNNLVKNKDKKVNILFQGIITFLILMTKQNIGIYYLMALSVYIFTKQDKIKNIFKLGTTIVIPGLIFLGYMYCTGELYNFINYAFLGIGEFAQNNIIVEGYTPTLILISVQIVTFILAISQILENKKKNKKDEILKILLIFSVANLLLAYPIFNLYHVTTGSIIVSIMLAYILYGYISKRELDKEEKIIVDNIIRNIIILLTVVIVILLGDYIIKLNKAFNEIESKFTKQDPFFGGIISQEEPEYDEVMQFIIDKENEGSKVIIFDVRANLYMVPLNKNNQNYDLPMLGNWGKNGEDNLLEDVKQRNDTYFLIYKETKSITTQESTKIKEYIKENSRYDGKIGKYEIYYKN